MYEINSLISEACGIHAGDGYMRDEGIRREIDISGNVDEADYYLDHVCPIFSDIFGVEICPRFFPHRNTFGFVLRGKDFTNVLHEFGFSYGNKTKTVAVPNRILITQDRLIYSSFLRGILDTEGHIGFRRYYGKGYDSFKTTHKVYPFISIATVSKQLHEDLKVMLNFLGFTFNSNFYQPKKKGQSSVYKITLNGINNMNKWMEEIGSKNNSKFSRYQIWEKFGFCPTNLSYAQRKDILNGENLHLLGL
jgi:hypothetical protein